MRDLQVGAQSAGYRIEGLAGRGGMGVVYRARHLRLDRVDAVKVIAPELAEDAAFRARFERESRVAARIEHPNVVTIYDAMRRTAGCIWRCGTSKGPTCVRS